MRNLSAQLSPGAVDNAWLSVVAEAIRAAFSLGRQAVYRVLPAAAPRLDSYPHEAMWAATSSFVRIVVAFPDHRPLSAPRRFASLIVDSPVEKSIEELQSIF
jgi:hypothetical protein